MSAFIAVTARLRRSTAVLTWRLSGSFQRVHVAAVWSPPRAAAGPLPGLRRPVGSSSGRAGHPDGGGGWRGEVRRLSAAKNGGTCSHRDGRLRRFSMIAPSARSPAARVVAESVHCHAGNILVPARSGGAWDQDHSVEVAYLPNREVAWPQLAAIAVRSKWRGPRRGIRRGAGRISLGFFAIAHKPP